MAAPPLSAVGALARQGDPDRFRAAMFAAPERREALFALIAFNLELAKIGPTVSEPMLGQIRLAWWCEAVEELYATGVPRGHEVLEALAAAPPPDPAPLYAMIEARHFDIGASEIVDQAGLDAYLKDTGGALARAMAEVLGATAEEAELAERVGAAEAAGRLIAATLAMIADGLRPLPIDGALDVEALNAGRTPPALAQSARALADQALTTLAAARAGPKPPRQILPAFLSAHAAERALYAAQRAEGDLFALDAGASPLRASLAFAWRAAMGRF